MSKIGDDGTVERTRIRKGEEGVTHIGSAMATSDPDKLISKADKLTKLSLTRWSADWKTATGLYEQAANAYRLKKKYEEAKDAFEKASKGQEMLSSPWDAAKHMESAAALAKQVGKWNEVADFYRHASELFIECGRSQPASDALAKGARYTDAATILLKWALAADKSNATHSQCKAYLSAIIVYLYAHDFRQAEKCHNDCCQVEAFLYSDQNRAATKLLSAYTDGDVEEIKLAAQSSIISNLDHVIVRIARKLPTGDVSGLKRTTTEEQDELLDEDDLT
ncbi:gamma-soluble NSF attachment protein isoform X2 [Primulina huaijiensis]|uniref:gamma-soluble NSF attachment protein isoform X2 n=1 Tax=Primulina huaijiensis TaxID=1492673 RepID=UPI003CC733B9